MDNTNHTTEHRKGQHLLNEERHEIEVRLKDGWTVYRIAKHLGRPYNTIKNEIKRGTVSLYNGKQKRDKADEGERIYKENRRRCRRIYHCLKAVRFLRYVVTMFKSPAKWSLDAAFDAARKSGKFRRDEMVCTKTLYNYVDLGLLPIKNIDLPEKLIRNTKTEKVRENKRNLGTSIEERPEIVNFRTEFGHWEADTVIGKKNEGDPCILTLVERMTRMCLWIKAVNYTAEAIQTALEQVMASFGSKKLEKMMEITSSIYVDTNGDGTRDNTDIVGFVAAGFPYRWLESFGVEAYKKTAADSAELTLDINTEITYAFIDKLHRWFYSGNDGVWERFDEGTSVQNDMFAGGNAAFVSDVIGRLAPIVADTDLNYGIVPFPKLDEQQTEYNAGCNSELIHVPLWTQNTERTGAVIEAMSYVGYKNILPAYCEKTLKTRYATDQDCTAMLNLVYKNQILSFAYLFSTTVPDGMQYRLIMDTMKDNNVASYYQKNEAKELTAMEKIMEFYAD